MAKKAKSVFPEWYWGGVVEWGRVRWGGVDPSPVHAAVLLYVLSLLIPIANVGVTAPSSR